MRYLFLLVTTIIAFQAHAQRKSRHPEYFLKAQGGYFIDVNDYKNYKGFNIANIGWAKYQKGVLQEVDLEFSKYNLDDKLERISLELSYNHLFTLTGDISHGVFMGPFASLMFLEKDNAPTIESYLSMKKTCYCLAIGAKLHYIFALNEYVYVNFASGLSLLDIGLLREYAYDFLDPTEFSINKKFHADFIRPQYQLMLGLNIKL